MGMKIMKRYKRVIAMSAAAFGLLAALTVDSTTAYFTASVSAEGRQVVNLGSDTEITEEPGIGSKDITITNTSGNACFVRVKAFAPAQVPLNFTDEEGNWSVGDEGYWYYGPTLAAGASASVLQVKFDIPEDFDRDNFNLVVVQECTPVRHREDGTEYADWGTVYTDYQEVNDGGEADNP